jgi:hypothetical protein
MVDYWEDEKFTMRETVGRSGGGEMKGWFFSFRRECVGMRGREMNMSGILEKRKGEMADTMILGDG